MPRRFLLYALPLPTLAAAQNNIFAAFEEYKNNNFTVLGFSLDRGNARSAWAPAERLGDTGPQKVNLIWFYY
ncbi:MAG: hypothetical protein ABIN80_31335 [Dyadobacter sp.]|uniref:hypothetical protein n=1 Tax=Dyadobacter sp. TaxID=1914288 RepID=UPI0032663459